ncbi:uncharacterized protein [Clytia hemisphaerica]|uniref:Mab-21-like HhH/H2TH-like domain-containing protein n=1 Tax=Clytia hemisphaerica TaxID=252671 RepID=A0A7M5X0D3_9CNID
MDEEINKVKRDYHHWEMILKNITEAELDFVGLEVKKGNILDMICHYDERYPPSHSLFPSIMRTYTSGSVAEKLNTTYSDLDNIYEIGPGVVRNKVKSKSDTVKRALYYVETEHKGFYQIEDQDGDFLYPILIQRALYHQLKINDPEQKANVLENNLSVDSKSNPNPSICTAKRDKVIALRLDQWPDEIQQSFLQRNPNLERCTEIPLLLVPKSHPESKSPEVEWRLSFSLVEKEILLNLPISWRKAYQIAKSAYRTFYNDYMGNFSLKGQQSYKESLLKSYHIKTVLMWLNEEQPDFDQNDIIGLLQLIFDRLLQAIDELNLPNYFIPKQNLLSINSLTDSTQINELRIMLKAFSMTLREPPDLSQSDDVKMRCFKLSISEGALSMLKKVPDGYRFGESRSSYLMSFFKDCMNSFLTFFNDLFHSKFRGLHYISTCNIQPINRSFYHLAMVKFGLVGLESKVFSLSKLLAEYLDRFWNLQNMPCPDEKINTKIMVDLQLDQEEMKQLQNSDITKLFNEIHSEIKEDIARYETNFDGEYIATRSGYNCLCSDAGKQMTFTEKTIRTPVEIFQTLYEIHLKQHIQRVNQMVQNQLREDERIKSELNQRQQYQKENREFREALSKKYEMDEKRRHNEKIQRMSQRDQRMFDMAKREEEIGPWESDKQIEATQAQQEADQKKLEADLAQEKADLNQREIVQRHWEAIQQDWTPEEQSEINDQENWKSLQWFTSWERNLNGMKKDREYRIRQQQADRQTTACRRKTK